MILWITKQCVVKNFHWDILLTWFCSQGTIGHENGNTLKKVHVKKPLNAFMLYMKEMRSKVISECTLKESAAINQILGKRVSLRKMLHLFRWEDFAQ